MGNFKNLRVWHDAISLATNIYSLSRNEPFAKDFILCDQVRRAVVSISSNIAEGDERGGEKGAIYFFNVAKGSVAETITQLHIAHSIGYIDRETLNRLEDQGEKIRASLKNLIKSKKAPLP